MYLEQLFARGAQAMSAILRENCVLRGDVNFESLTSVLSLLVIN